MIVGKELFGAHTVSAPIGAIHRDRHAGQFRDHIGPSSRLDDYFLGLPHESYTVKSVLLRLVTLVFYQAMEAGITHSIRFVGVGVNSGENSLLIVGDVVEHKVFGKGMITSISGANLGSKMATIKFYGHAGTRNFALAWAPLRKINTNYQNGNKVANSPVISSIAANEDYQNTKRTFQELLKTLRTLHGIPDSNFSGYQILENISKADLIAYTNRYGFRHLQELRNALRELFVTSGHSSAPLSPVEVLDIGCAQGLSRYILPEFGINAKTYSGVDYAESCLWLAKELNSHVLNLNKSSSLFGSQLPQMSKLGEFVKSLYDIKTSEIRGFVIMNHVQNQDSVSESTLLVWAEQLKRIYPLGFYLVSVEPQHSKFAKRAILFRNQLLRAGVEIRNSDMVFARGEFTGKPIAVNFLTCGR